MGGFLKILLYIPSHLNLEEHQPSKTCNFCIDNAQLVSLAVNAALSILPLTTTSSASCRCMGGLAYSN